MRLVGGNLTRHPVFVEILIGKWDVALLALLNLLKTIFLIFIKNNLTRHTRHAALFLETVVKNGVPR